MGSPWPSYASQIDDHIELRTEQNVGLAARSLRKKK
jgi:hypothetical protein